MSKTSGSRRYVGFNERYKGKPSKPGNKQDAYGAAPTTQAVATGPPYVLVNDPDFTLYVGDVLEVLRELPDESVHCVVTSPPYWGLRDYGTGSWAGGDPDCDHVAPKQPDRTFTNGRGENEGYAGTNLRAWTTRALFAGEPA